MIFKCTIGWLIFTNAASVLKRWFKIFDSVDSVHRIATTNANNLLSNKNTKKIGRKFDV